MRALVSGYFGFHNAGDEAILAGMKAALERAGDVELAVLSADPEDTARVHGVKAIDRMALAEVWRALRGGVDLFISGGGGLIQDRTSRRSAYYYLGLIRMAQKAGVPVYLYGQGVGPVQSVAVRLAAKRALAGIAGAGARDPASAQLFVRLGADPGKVQVSADAAFALDPVHPGDVGEDLEQHGIPLGRRPLIGVVWRRVDSDRRPQLRQEARRSVAAAVAELARSAGARVVVIGLHQGVDDDEAEAFAEAVSRAGAPWVHRPRGLRTFWEWRALVSAMDVNVCVRYHGLLFSAVNGVPALALAYDPKVEGLASQLGLPFLPVQCDPSELREALFALWEDAGNAALALSEPVRALRRKAFAEARRCLACASHGLLPRGDEA